MAERKSRTTLVVFLALLMLFLVINALMVGPYLLAVLMGGILSLLARPLYARLRSRKLGPRTASSLVTIALLLVIVGPIGGFVSVAVQQGQAVIASIARSNDLSLESVLGRISRVPLVRHYVGDPDEVEARLRSGLENVGKELSASVLALAGSLPDKVLQIVLAALTCFFFLTDGGRFMGWLNDKIPLDRDVRGRLYSAFRDTSISTIWATLAAAAAQAAVIAVGFWILGVPGAVLAAGATFIFAWIPVLGTTPVWVAGTIYLYTQDRVSGVVAMLVVGAIAGLTDNFVRPIVLKGRADIHPLVSLVAIFGGIQMFGILGVFIGPILTSTLLALLTIWPVVARRFGLVTNGETWVETPSGILVEPMTGATAAGVVLPGEQPVESEPRPVPRGPAGNA
jgi:predicted PurR-regulated permease PerM